jgi:hypothetical protein
MSITRKLQKNLDIGSFPGEIPMNYKYTVGVAGEAFFTALRDKGQLHASECPDCGHVYFPSRIFCERCFARIEDSFDVGTKGTLMSYTISFEDFKGEPLETPEYWGLVQMYDTDTVLVHRLGGKNMDCMCVGGEVKAVLETKKKRTGSINDIRYFEFM